MSTFLERKRQSKELDIYLNKYYNSSEKNFRNKEELNYAVRQACADGNLEHVKFLVEEKGANIHFHDLEYNDCCLMIASQNGHLPVVEYLVQKGANTHERGAIALRWACAEGHLHIVRFFVERCNIDVTVYGNDALVTASKYGHLELVKYIVEHGGDVNAEHVLWQAAAFSRLEVVKYLVELGSDIHRVHGTVFTYACDRGDLEIVEYLLQNGVNAREKTNGIIAASLNGHLSVIRCLVRNGANISGNINEYDALYCACMKGHMHIVKYIFEKCKSGNADRQECIHTAAEGGYLDIVRYLLEHGGDLSGDYDCQTLKWSIYYRDFDSFLYFVQKGAQNNQKENVCFAAQCDFLPVVRHLLEGGDLDVDDKDDKDGEEELQLQSLRKASEYGSLSVLKYLVSNLNTEINPFLIQGTSYLNVIFYLSYKLDLPQDYFYELIEGNKCLELYHSTIIFLIGFRKGIDGANNYCYYDGNLGMVICSYLNYF